MMNNTITINLAKEADEFLGARYPEESDVNGEEFRENVLLPAFKKYKNIIIDIEDVIGFTWSFLDEAFGGSVWAMGGIGNIELRLSISATKNYEWKQRIQEYMEEAEEARKKGLIPEKRWRKFAK
ncbi:STAS-like domain-containing protein [Patescibacteria group bacterium]|nr:STAS-like domain-containing protein [Patescibacteria group bacterium]